MECIFPDWMVLIKLSTVKISCKVNISIMPLKDYFLPLYGFYPIWGALSQNISGWVMDLRLLRHVCWHFKGDTWAMKFWTRGRNVLFQNVTARVFCLVYHHGQGTASFFVLICVVYSVGGSCYNRSVFSHLGALGYLCHHWGPKAMPVPPSGYATSGSLTLNFCTENCVYGEKYPFSTPEKLFIILTRGSNSIKTSSSHRSPHQL